MENERGGRREGGGERERDEKGVDSKYVNSM